MSIGWQQLRLDRYWSSRYQYILPADIFCQYICTNISATDTDIYMLADILLITGILADIHVF